MIAFVRGPVLSIENETLIIDAGSLGYQVMVPLNQMDPAPAVGIEIFLYTHLQIREDAWQLFGFPTKEQLFGFRLFLAVSGIGAKTALGIMNNMSMGQIVKAVLHADYNFFAKVPGIGKKTAQRIVLELKDKFKDIAVADDEQAMAIFTTAQQPETAEDDIVLAALKQLGYTQQEAKLLAAGARKSLAPAANENAIIKEALRIAAMRP